jgi:hypothetical protein
MTAGPEHPQARVVARIRTRDRSAAAQACLTTLLAQVPPDRWPVCVSLGRALMTGATWRAAWLQAAAPHGLPVCICGDADCPEPRHIVVVTCPLAGAA